MEFGKTFKKIRLSKRMTLKEAAGDISSSEKKTIQIAVLNFISLVNGLQTGKEIVMNRLDDEAAENLGYEVHLSPKVSDEEREGFIGQAERQISLFLKMAEIPYEMEIVK